LFPTGANGLNGMDAGGANGIECDIDSGGIDCASGIARGGFGIQFRQFVFLCLVHDL
jgi:hypothetical protein